MPTGNHSQQSASRFSRTAQPMQADASQYEAGHTQRRSDYAPQSYYSSAEESGYTQVGNIYGQQDAYGQASGTYSQAGGTYGQADNPYTSGATQYGYTPASDNPYISGPTSGAVGITPERVRSQPKRGRFKTTGEVQQGMPGTQRKRKRRAPMFIIIVLILAVLAGGGAYLWFNPPFYNITINGVERLVKSGMTIQEVLDENYATPTPGNLLAIDGTVYTEGGGDAFEATVDGTAVTDANYAIPRHAVVEISDGNDVTEDYTETTQTIAHGTTDTDYTSASTYWAGAIHVYSAGVDGEETVKTGSVSGIQLTEVTKEAVDAGYSVFSVDTNGDKVIALTFDDGPWGDTTTQILDILAENDAKATFFEIGNQCAEYPEQVKRIISEGHQIATHSYDHASGSGQGVNLTFMSAEEQRNEISKGFSAIEEVAGTTVSRVMRAPGGNYYGSIVTNLADLVAVEVGWDVDTEDWRKPGAESIAATIKSAKPGNVILMHDGGGDRSQTVEGLRQALPALKAEGYSFVTIDELLSKYANIDTSALNS